MKIKHLFVMLFFCFLGVKSYSQDSAKVEHLLKPNAISFSYLGTSSIFGFTYERLIKQCLTLEAGVGVFGVGMGVTYMPKKYRFGKFYPYFGVKQTRFAAPTAFDSYVIYTPLGLNFISKNNLHLGLDIGPCYWREYNIPRFTEDYRPHRLLAFGNFKIGYRFGGSN